MTTRITRRRFLQLIGYGSVDQPFREAFVRVVGVGWNPKGFRKQRALDSSSPYLTGTNPGGLRSTGSWATWMYGFADDPTGQYDGFFANSVDGTSGGFDVEVKLGRIDPTFDDPFQTGFGMFPRGAWVDDSDELHWTIRPDDSVVITFTPPDFDPEFHFRADQSDMAYGVWHNVLISWDVALGRKNIVIDDVVKTVVYEPEPFSGQDDGGVQDDSGAIPSLGQPLYMVGGLGAHYDWWLSTEYIDFSITDNRRRFITADKKPKSLGANGEKGSPTERQPEFFFRPGADLAAFTRNRGSGGVCTWEADPVFSKVDRPTIAGT